jgi:hypothetical protein
MVSNICPVYSRRMSRSRVLPKPSHLSIGASHPGRYVMVPREDKVVTGSRSTGGCAQELSYEAIKRRWVMVKRSGGILLTMLAIILSENVTIPFSGSYGSVSASLIADYTTLFLSVKTSFFKRKRFRSVGDQMTA